MSKKYKNNFINSFIVRFDFNSFYKDVNTDKIRKALQKEFPIVEGKTIQGHQIIMENNINIAPTIQPTNVINESTLISADSKTRIVLSNLAFVYETQDYTTFDEIKEKIISILKILEIENQIKNFNRVGVRYVNLIKLPCKKVEDLFDWKGYIDDKLLGNHNLFSDDQKNLLQLVNVFNLKSSSGEEVIYTVQTGLLNQNFPASMMEKLFLIDIDGYTKSMVEKDEIINLFDIIHEEENEIFEKCIGPKLRGLMNE